MFVCRSNHSPPRPSIQQRHGADYVKARTGGMLLFGVCAGTEQEQEVKEKEEEKKEEEKEKEEEEEDEEEEYGSWVMMERIGEWQTGDEHEEEEDLIHNNCAP